MQHTDPCGCVYVFRDCFDRNGRFKGRRKQFITRCYTASCVRSRVWRANARHSSQSALADNTDSNVPSDSAFRAIQAQIIEALERESNQLPLPSGPQVIHDLSPAPNPESSNTLASGIQHAQNQPEDLLTTKPGTKPAPMRTDGQTANLNTEDILLSTTNDLPPPEASRFTPINRPNPTNRSVRPNRVVKTTSRLDRRRPIPQAALSSSQSQSRQMRNQGEASGQAQSNPLPTATRIVCNAPASPVKDSSHSAPPEAFGSRPAPNNPPRLSTGVRRAPNPPPQPKNEKDEEKKDKKKKKKKKEETWLERCIKKGDSYKRHRGGGGGGGEYGKMKLRSGLRG